MKTILLIISIHLKHTYDNIRKISGIRYAAVILINVSNGATANTITMYIISQMILIKTNPLSYSLKVILKSHATDFDSNTKFINWFSIHIMS